MKNFSTCSINLRRLNRGGVALYLYWTKYIKDNKKEDEKPITPPPVDQSIKQWAKFINSISKDNKLNDLSLTDFTNKNKWDDVLKAIKEKLVEEFDKVFGNKTDLLIELQDEKEQTLDPKTDIGLYYLKDKKIKIVLSYGKNKSLKNTFDIDFKALSPLTKFIKTLKDKNLGTFYDLDDWAKVEDKIKNLIDKLGFKNDITIVPIDKTKDWKVGKNQTVIVNFKWKNDASGKIEFKFNVVESDKTRWLNFVKEVEQKKILNSIYSNKIDEDNTWQQLISLLENGLKDLFEETYNLGNLKNKLKIDLPCIKDKTQKIFKQEKTPIELKVKLTYKTFEPKELIIKKFPLSEEKRWLAFIESIKGDNNQLLDIDLTDKFDLTNSWSDVKTKIKELLKNKLDEYGLLDSELDISFDEYKNLSAKIDAKYKKANNLEITLSYKEFKEKPVLIIKDFQISKQARWSDFIEAVQKDKNKLLTSIDWSTIENGATWEKVIRKIKEQLENTWKGAKLGDADIFNKLDIKLTDQESKKALTANEPIDRTYAESDRKITIELSYNGEDDLEKPEIKDIIVKPKLALSTRWDDFIKAVQKDENKLLTSIDWSTIENGATWEKVIRKIKEQLENTWKGAKLGDADIFNKLDIKLTDQESKKALTANEPIDRTYAESDRKITIELSYNGEDDLEKPEIKDIIVKPKLALSTRWDDFIKAVQKDENKLLTSIDWSTIENGATWEKVIRKIKEQLENTWKGAKLGDADIFNKLDIKLTDQESKKALSDTDIIDRIYAESDRKITIELSYNGENDLAKPEIKDITFKPKLALSTRWDDFIKAVQKDGNKLLTSIDWSTIENGATWQKVIRKIKEQLENTWKDAKLDDANIFDKLDIKLIDQKSKKALSDTDIIDRIYAESDRKITIELSYNGENDLAKPEIKDITFKPKLALSTRWDDFIKAVQKDGNKLLTSIDWSTIENGATWQKVIRKIKEQLENTWKDAKLDDANIFDKLDIKLIDQKSKKALSDTDIIDRIYAESDRKITIELSYNGENDLAKPEIKDITFKPKLALSTRWDDFIKAVQKDGNKLLTSIDWSTIENGATWQKVIRKIKEQLENTWKDAKLDDANIFDKLDIKLIDQKSKKALSDTDIIDRIYAESDRKITIELSYNGENDLAKPEIKDITFKPKLALSTRWDDFIKAVQKDDNKLLTSIDWSTIENGATWQKVIRKIKEQLENTWKDAKLDDANIFDKLDIKLIDQKSKKALSDTDIIDRIYAESDRKITIELSYNGENDLAKPEIKDITFKPKLALSTRWDDFIKAVQKDDNKLLTSIDWSTIENGATWQKVITKIKEQLENTWKDAKLDDANIFDKLDIKLIDQKSKKALSDTDIIDRIYAESDRKITIELSYNGENDLAKPKIEDITFKPKLALSTRWDDFIKAVQKDGNKLLTSIDWSTIENGATWQKVIRKIKEQLENTWKDAKLDDANIFDKLDIKLIDQKSKKALSDTDIIDRIYAESDRKITIELSYNGENDLAKPKIEDITFKPKLALSTRWDDFIKAVQKDDNKLLTSIDWSTIENGATWQKVIRKIKEQLENTWKDAKLDDANIFDKLDIKLIDQKSKKALSDTDIIDRIYAESDRKITIELSYNGENDLAKPEIKDITFKPKLALSTRWDDFIKAVQKDGNKLLTSIDWSTIENGATWQKVIRKIKEQLENTWKDAKLDDANIFDKLDIKLIDQKSKKALSDTDIIDRIYAESDRKITIELSYNGENDLAKPEIKDITFKPKLALSTRWDDFIKAVQKDDNKLLTSIDWSTIENGATWQKVIRKIKEQLENTWKDAKLDDANIFDKLDIKLIDQKSKKALSDTDIIDRIYAESDRKITIELSYNGENDLAKPEIKDITFKPKLALSTRWDDFIKAVQKDGNKLLTSIDWSTIENGATWQKVIRKIKEQLENTWKDAKLDDANIFDKLDIKLIDQKSKKALSDTDIIDRIYAESDRKITIELSYNGENDLAKPKIEDITFKPKLALSTRWDDFIKAVQKDGNKLLTSIDWSTIENGATWQKVIRKIKEQLENTWKDAKLDDANIFDKLDIKLTDQESKKALSDTDIIDRIYAESDRKITIELSYNGENDLAKPEIKDITFKPKLALSTRWDDFIKAVQKDGNKLLTSIDWSTIENGATWQKVIRKIKEQLENTWKDAKLDDANIFDKLDIKLIDQKSKKALSDTDIIDRIYAESDRKITIELSYNGENDLAKPEIKDITFKPKLALSTRWDDFIKAVQKDDNKLLTSIDWSTIENGATWQKVIRKIKEQLENTWKDAKLDDANIFDKLDIKLIDQKSKKALSDTDIIDRIYAESDRKITIELSYNGENDLAKPKIEDITFKPKLALSTRWDDFIKAVQKDGNKLLTSIDWSTIENGATWQKVIRKIKEQLENTWKDAKLDDANIFDKLDIKLIDQKSKKALSDTDIIDRIYAESDRKITIELSYNGENDLAKPEIEDITFKPKLALSTRWDDFIKAVQKDDNKLLTSIDWSTIENGATWQKVIRKIKEQLENTWKDAKLDDANIFDKLDIKLIDQKSKKALSDTDIIDRIYAESDRKITIELSYNGENDLAKPEIKDITFKPKLALSTRWDDFIKAVQKDDNKLLTSIDWSTIENGATWQKVIRKIKEQLENTWKDAKLDDANIFDKLDIKLIDQKSKKALSDTDIIDRIYAESDRKITIELSYNGENDLAKPEIKDITFKPKLALSTRWDDFIKAVQKDDNKLLTSIDWSTIENGATWQKVIRKIKEQLENTWKDAKLDDANIFDKLDIKLIDQKSKKALSDTDIIDRIYAESDRKITIELSYNGENDLAKPKIEDITFKPKLALSTRWDDFIKAVQKDDNKLLTSIDWSTIENGATWQKVIRKIKEQLENTWKDAKLDDANIFDKLDIKLIDQKSKKALSDTDIIDRIYAESDRKITIELSYNGENDLAKPEIKDITFKPKLALSTRWDDFIKAVQKDDNKLLTSIDWSTIENGATWQKVIRKIKEQLENTWKDAKLDDANIFDKLDIKLIDQKSKKALSDTDIIDRIYAESDRKITIELSYNGENDLAKPEIKDITFKPKLALSTRWDDFIKAVQKDGNKLLTSIDWSTIENGATWQKVIRKIKEQLENTWKDAKLDDANIFDKLDIKLIDQKSKKALSDTDIIDRIYAESDRKITIELSYNGENDLAKPEIKDITFKPKLALSTRWDDFIKAVQKDDNKLLTSIDWSTIENGATWQKVIRKIKEQLENTWKDAKLDDANIFDKLDIKLIDQKSKKALSDTDIIDRIYAESDRKITIELSYNGENDLAKPKIEDITFKPKLALSTRWDDFIKAVQKDGNKLLTSIDWSTIENGATWQKVIRKIKEQLENTWKDAKLDDANIFDKLDIKLIDQKSKKALSDTDIIDRIYAESDRKITIELSYNGENDLAKPKIEDITFKPKLALSTRWDDFIKAVESSELLKSLANLDKIKDGENWEKVIDFIRDKLDQLWKNNGLGDIKNLDIKLYGNKDKDNLLSGEIPNSYSNNKQKIKIKLSYKEKPELKEREFKDIDMQLAKSFSTRWANFVHYVETKELLESIDWNKITKYSLYKDLIPLFREKLKNLFENTYNLGDISKLSTNLFTIQKTPLIDQQIGQVWNKKIIIRLTMISPSNKSLLGDINTKIKIKIDLQDLTPLFTQLVKEKEPDNQEEFKKFLQEMFDYHYPLYKVDVENELIVKINPPIFNIESVGNFYIQYKKNNTKFKNSSINNTIAYYEKYRISFVLFRHALTKILNDNPIENKQELDNIIKKLLDEYNFNKYKNQKIIDFTDLTIDFKLNDGKTSISTFVSLKKQLAWKALLHSYFNINNIPYKLYKMFQDFKDEFRQDKNIASLRKHLEKQDSYSTWEELDEIARKWVKDKYGSKYKRIFDVGSLDIHFFSPVKLTGEISDIYYEKKEFSGSIFIRLQQNTNFLYSHYEKINFKLNLTSLNIEDPKYNLIWFVDNLLEKDANNDEKTFIDLFIKKLNSIKGFKNKFKKEDFNFVFKPATKKDNKIEIEITPKNKNKIHGKIQRHSYYEKYMIDLEDENIEQDIQNLINKNQPDNQEVFEKLLQAYFDSKYKDYDIDVKKHLYITFEKPTFNNLKDGVLNISADQSVRKFKNKLIITIPYYDKYKLDFSEFENKLKDKLISNTPNNENELTQIVKELLNTYSLNKYNNQNIINIGDLIINYNLKKPITKESIIKITISLNQDKKLKSRNKASFDINLTPKVVFEHRKFVKDLNKTNNLNSLKQFLEKETFSYWEEVEKKVITWLKDNYGSEYKLLFDKEKIEIDFWEGHKLTDKIRTDKKEFDGKIKIMFNNNEFNFEDEFNFKFNLINPQSLLEDYAKEINNKTLNNMVFKFNYYFNSYDFISDLEDQIKEFLKNKKLNGEVVKSNILNKDTLKFKTGNNSIFIKLTYLGVTKDITLKYNGQKLDLSKYTINDVITITKWSPLNEYAFDKVDLKKSDFIYKFVETLKEKYSDFNGINIDKHIKLFTFEYNGPLFAANPTENYTFYLTSTLKDFVTGRVKVRFSAEKNPFIIEKLLEAFLKEKTKLDENFRDMMFYYSYRTYFDGAGMKKFEQIKEHFRQEIEEKLKNKILQDGWFSKIMYRNDIKDYKNFSVTNLSFDKDYSFQDTNLKFKIGIKYNGGQSTNNSFISIKQEITNPFNMKMKNYGLSYDDGLDFLNILNNEQKEYNYTIKADKSNDNVGDTETGFINTYADDFTDIKGFIKSLIMVVGIKWKKYVPKLDEEISSDDNGYFFYFLDEYGIKKSVVLRVFVDYYNNDGNYQKDINYSFSSGNIEFQLLHMKNTIYGASKVYDWTQHNRKYKLINRTEYEWYSKFRSELDNKNEVESSWWFDPSNDVRYAGQYILDKNISWSSPKLWGTYGGKWKHDGNDHFLYEFGLENKDGISNGRKYVLKLGGTGDIEKIYKTNTGYFLNYQMKYAFTILGGKVRLNFNLYRSDDYDRTNDKLLLPIGKGKRYHLAR